MNTNRKVKAVIIGTGMIANEGHIPAYHALPDEVELTAVCDVNPEIANSCARRYNIPRCYSDPVEMLRYEQPDLVSVCTPNLTHPQMVRLALENNAHVLCEKPLALHYKEAKELFELAAQKERMLITCQTMRFSRPYYTAHEYVAEGLLGKPYYGEINRIRRRGIPAWGKFLKKEYNGGGALADIGVHTIDSMLWVLGNPRVKAVLGHASRAIIDNERGIRYDLRESGALADKSGLVISPDFSTCDVEEFASGVIMTDGPSINFKVAWAANLPPTTEMTALGDKMGIQFPDLKVYSSIGHDQADVTPRLFPMGPHDNKPFAGHYYLVENVVNAILGREEAIVKPEETLNVVAVLELFYRSVEKGEIAYREELEQ